MKNKFLSIILCAFLLVGSLIFSACDKGYNLKNFSSDYVAIADKDGVANSEEGYLEFEFAKIKEAIVSSDGQGSETNEKCVESLNKYYYPLADNENGVYGYLTKNSQKFLVYVKDMITSEDKTSKEDRNAIKSGLNVLSDKAGEVNSRIKEFTRVISFSTNDVDRKPYFNKLTSALCGFYTACRNLSFKVSNVFFNDVLDNENNFNIANTEGYGAQVYYNLPDIAYMHVFNLTQNFVEMYVDGNEDKLITSEFDKYKGDVDNIVNLVGKLKNYHLKESDSLYKKIIELYALNGMLINERTVYLNACNDIEYYNVSVGGAIDYNEEENASVIYGYKQNLDELTLVLTKILQSTEAN